MKKLQPEQLLLSACALLPTAAIAQKNPSQKPNIVVINIDDMGYSDPWCFGGDYAPTPNIDRMAEEGRSLKFPIACGAYDWNVSNPVGNKYIPTGKGWQRP